MHLACVQLADIGKRNKFSFLFLFPKMNIRKYIFSWSQEMVGMILSFHRLWSVLNCLLEIARTIETFLCIFGVVNSLQLLNPKDFFSLEIFLFFWWWGMHLTAAEEWITYMLCNFMSKIVQSSFFFMRFTGKVHKLTKILSGNVTIFFNIACLMVYTLLLLVLQCLYLIVQKVINIRKEIVIWTFQPTFVYSWFYSHNVSTVHSSAFVKCIIQKKKKKRNFFGKKK